jgi:hypothetical protein
MASKWVDNTEYFGPDRRKRSGHKRWSDRRRDNEASELPPLGALLRRLRVLTQNLAAPDDRRRAIQIMSGALREAHRLGYPRCAAALQAADRALREPGGGGAADAHLVEAMSCLAIGR